MRKGDAHTDRTVSKAWLKDPTFSSLMEIAKKTHYSTDVLVDLGNFSEAYQSAADEALRESSDEIQKHFSRYKSFYKELFAQIENYIITDSNDKALAFYRFCHDTFRLFSIREICALCGLGDGHYRNICAFIDLVILFKQEYSSDQIYRHYRTEGLFYDYLFNRAVFEEINICAPFDAAKALYRQCQEMKMQSIIPYFYPDRDSLLFSLADFRYIFNENPDWFDVRQEDGIADDNVKVLQCGIHIGGSIIAPSIVRCSAGSLSILNGADAYKMILFVPKPEPPVPPVSLIPPVPLVPLPKKPPETPAQPNNRLAAPNQSADTAPMKTAHFPRPYAHAIPPSITKREAPPEPFRKAKMLPEPINYGKSLENLADALDRAADSYAADPVEPAASKERKEIQNAARKIRILLDNKTAIETTLPHARNKKIWLQTTIQIYALLDDDPFETYKHVKKAADFTGGALGQAILEAEKAFALIWEECVTQLQRQGIQKVDVSVGSIIGRNEISLGWELQNPENRKTDGMHRGYEVYKVVRSGILADRELVRRPVVNVYTD